MLALYDKTNKRYRNITNSMFSLKKLNPQFSLLPILENLLQAYYRLTTGYYKFTTVSLQAYYKFTTDLLHAGLSLQYKHEHTTMAVLFRGYCWSFWLIFLLVLINMFICFHALMSSNKEFRTKLNNDVLFKVSLTGPSWNFVMKQIYSLHLRCHVTSSSSLTMSSSTTWYYYTSITDTRWWSSF